MPSTSAPPTVAELEDELKAEAGFDPLNPATGPAAAARKEGVGGLSFLSEDMHNTILGTCERVDAAHNAAVEPDLYGPNGELLNPAPDIEYEEETEHV